MEHPNLADRVYYRGKQGLATMRAAIVTATLDTLDPRGVEAGHVPALDSENHLHLHVLTPSAAGFFTEFNVPKGEVKDGEIPSGTWCWAPEYLAARRLIRLGL